MRTVEENRLFGGLPEADLTALRACAQTKRFQPGEVIFREGDLGDGLYLIAEGQIQISAMLADGERGMLARLGPGDYFGEMAIVDDEPRSATAAAEEQSVLYFIPRDEVLQLLARTPKLAVSLVREFSKRMRDFNRQYIREVVQAERLAIVGRFARSIVHDFKNPLNIIGIAAEMAGMAGATPESRASAQERILKQVERLNNMIEELLEFTRGTQSRAIFAEADYVGFVRQLFDDLSGEFSGRDIRVEWPDEVPRVLVPMDGARLMHVFHNLVHNAIDAMPEGGTIKLRFQFTGEKLVTEVEDTGKGIAPQVFPHLFEPFVTFGKAKGTGLGLSICKRIIDDHRGRLEARNLPSGGAVFSFTLPARLCPPES